MLAPMPPTSDRVRCLHTIVACQLLLLVACGGCGSGPAGPSDADSSDAGSDADGSTAPPDADEPGGDADDPGEDADRDADSPDPVDADAASCEGMSADCASEFGSLFTRSNGRADGTLLALVGPTDSQCALYNDDHVVLELEMLGQAQRLVVAVDGVAVHSTSAELVGPAYAEGWHPDVHLDYPSQLGVHSTDFTAATMDEAVSFLCARVETGAPLSVYAYSDGSLPSSAHQVHRNDRYPDGAIVASPGSDDPTYLLFRYSDQVF